MKKSMKNWLIFGALVLVMFAVAYMLLGNLGSGTKIDSFSEVVQKFKSGQVTEFVVDKSNTLYFKDASGTTYTYKLRSLDLFYTELSETIEEQRAAGTLKTYEYQPPTQYPVWVSFLPVIILVIAMIFLFRYAAKQMSQGGGPGGKMNSFGKAKAKMGQDEGKKIYFADVAGADEEKEELREVVDYLRDVKKFTKLGARIPRGILLVGPPGTGKTLLAKAVAGEAGVPFYSISGSDFVEMYVGVGASRVRDLFDTARKNNASIIFIDEIDAVGRHRGAGLGGGHDEREQTLNQLLVEMDGFGTHEGIIVMAATNRPDILDPALLRPGRFDRTITVHYPDIKGREDILKVHSKGKPFEGDVDLKKIAKTTVGFTGADLANLLNEAALLAARKGKSLIGQNDIEEATLRILVGTSKKTKHRLEEETKMVAYHEAGHAVSRYYLDKLDKVKHISIIPTATAGGYTLWAPEHDKGLVSRESMQQSIVSALGGRVAEMIIFGDLTTGASSDIKHCTDIATDMVTKYGMSEKLGSVVFGGRGNSEVFLGRDFSSSSNYSDKTAADIDSEIKRIIDEAQQLCEKILTENIDKLHFIAQFLLKYETMDADQFEAAMSGEATFEELEAMVAEKKARSEEENRKRQEAEEAARARDEEEARKRDGEERPEGAFSHNPQDDLDKDDE